MSINDNPEIRKLFKDYRILEVPTKYSAHKSSVKSVTELIIMNYDNG